jgi:ADP-ribose pyrophosphatase YjhB (NUDIX family)
MRARLELILRRVLHFFWRFSRGLTVGVRAVVIDRENRVLLIKHSYVRGWHLPGGGVEPGETLIAALARELREEGAVEMLGPPTLHGFFYNPNDSRRDHVALFVVRAFRQGTPRRNYEIINHGFFAPAALPADTTPATRARIAEVVGGAPIAELW